jgi:predicted nucleic acid-binding protein
MKYILDTNVWVDVCRGRLSCNRLRHARERGETEYVWAPPVLVELFVGIASSGERNYNENKAMFLAAEAFQMQILELPIPFMWKLLWNISDAGASRVSPGHYRNLVEMLIASRNFTEFLRETTNPSSVWKQMVVAHRVHSSILDYELSALHVLASRGPKANLALAVARLFRLDGLMPDPLLMESKCSAALEFLRSALHKVRNGANPQKNDRGVYGDFQMFWYLADSNVSFVSGEDFSQEIEASTQRDRVIHLASLLDE